MLKTMLRLANNESHAGANTIWSSRPQSIVLVFEVILKPSSQDRIVNKIVTGPLLRAARRDFAAPRGEPGSWVDR